DIRVASQRDDERTGGRLCAIGRCDCRIILCAHFERPLLVRDSQVRLGDGWSLPEPRKAANGKEQTKRVLATRFLRRIKREHLEEGHCAPLSWWQTLNSLT